MTQDVWEEMLKGAVVSVVQGLKEKREALGVDNNHDTNARGWSWAGDDE